MLRGSVGGLVKKVGGVDSLEGGSNEDGLVSVMGLLRSVVGYENHSRPEI
jgi:hypothetical protein